jgi:hypothetical protein
VVVSVSSKPDVDILRVLVDSFYLSHLQAALGYVPLVDATHDQLKKDDEALSSLQPPEKDLL